MKKVYIAPVLIVYPFESDSIICASPSSSSPNTLRQSDLGDGTNYNILGGSDFNNNNNSGRGTASTGNRSKDYEFSFAVDFEYDF